VLRFYVRPQTYYQHCKDLKAYVTYLEASKNQETSLSTEAKRRNDSVGSGAAEVDHTPVPNAAQRDQDKLALDHTVPPIVSEKGEALSNKDWWKSDRSFTPPPPSTLSLPLVTTSLPLTLSSLQRPTSTPPLYTNHTTTTTATLSPAANDSWSIDRSPVVVDSSSHSIAASRSSSSDLQDLQDLQNEDLADTDPENAEEEEAEVDVDNDVDAAALFDTLSLANYEIGSLPLGVYNTSHTYPASPYPAWAMDDQDDDDDDGHEGTDNGNDRDDEEEEEEGLIRQ